MDEPRFEDLIAFLAGAGDERTNNLIREQLKQPGSKTAQFFQQIQIASKGNTDFRAVLQQTTDAESPLGPAASARHSRTGSLTFVRLLLLTLTDWWYRFCPHYWPKFQRGNIRGLIRHGKGWLAKRSPDRAAPWLLGALDCAQRYLPADDGDTTTCLYYLGELNLVMRQFEKARRCYDDALERIDRLHAGQHLVLAPLLLEAAFVALFLQQRSKAEYLILRAIDTCEKYHGSETDVYIFAHQLLASVYGHDQPDLAALYLHRTCDIFTRHFLLACSANSKRDRQKSLSHLGTFAFELVSAVAGYCPNDRSLASRGLDMLNSISGYVRDDPRLSTSMLAVTYPQYRREIAKLMSCRQKILSEGIVRPSGDWGSYAQTPRQGSILQQWKAEEKRLVQFLNEKVPDLADEQNILSRMTARLAGKLPDGTVLVQLMYGQYGITKAFENPDRLDNRGWQYLAFVTVAGATESTRLLVLGKRDALDKLVLDLRLRPQTSRGRQGSSATKLKSILLERACANVQDIREVVIIPAGELTREDIEIMVRSGGKAESLPYSVRSLSTIYDLIAA